MPRTRETSWTHIGEEDDCTGVCRKGTSPEKEEGHGQVDGSCRRVLAKDPSIAESLPSPTDVSR